MAKTEIEIERDFYTLVNGKCKKGSKLKRAINGEVYRRGQRPDNAKTEDCIVKFLAGDDSQIQTGTVILNIYVPYISFDGKMVEDLTRIGVLEEIARDFIKNIKNTDYDIKQDGTIRSYPEDDIEQSIIAIRLKFKRLNQE